MCVELWSFACVVRCFRLIKGKGKRCQIRRLTECGDGDPVAAKDVVGAVPTTPRIRYYLSTLKPGLREGTRRGGIDELKRVYDLHRRISETKGNGTATSVRVIGRKRSIFAPSDLP